MGDIACWMKLVLFFKIEIVSILVHMHNRGLDKGVGIFSSCPAIFFYEGFPKFNLDSSNRNFISSSYENFLYDEFYWAPTLLGSNWFTYPGTMANV